MKERDLAAKRLHFLFNDTSWQCGETFSGTNLLDHK